MLYNKNETMEILYETKSYFNTYKQTDGINKSIKYVFPLCENFVSIF
jgi:hypothetical protein